MGFIEAYTALYSGDKRKELFTEWVFRRRQELFVELREHAPFFVTPEAVFVSRHEDVKAIFEDSSHFNVKAYLGSYDFVLGKDKEDGHDADRAFLEGLLPQAELERVHKIAAEEIEKILGFMMTRHEGGALPGQREPRKPAGRIDVPHRFCSSSLYCCSSALLWPHRPEPGRLRYSSAPASFAPESGTVARPTPVS